MNKQRLIEIAESTDNPFIIEKMIEASFIDDRCLAYERKFKFAAKHGKGKVKLVFQAAIDAMIYDRQILLHLVGKKNISSSVDTMLKVVAEQQEGAYVDIGKRHSNFYNIALIMRQAIENGDLPLQDEEGDLIPLYPRYCNLEDSSQAVSEVIEKTISGMHEEEPKKTMKKEMLL